LSLCILSQTNRRGNKIREIDLGRGVGETVVPGEKDDKKSEKMAKWDQ